MSTFQFADVPLPDGTSYDALLWDWDGTLVDSRDLCFRSLRQALADCGVDLDPAWYWPRHAIASPDMLAEWEQTIGVLPEPIETIISRCRQYNIAGAHTVPVITETAAVARAAYKRGQPQGIGSNASATTLRASMTATRMAHLFSAVVTWSDVQPGRGKPHPDIFLMAADLLGVKPSRCLVYEDAEHGVAAALAAGMSAYDVTTRRFYPSAADHLLA